MKSSRLFMAIALGLLLVSIGLLATGSSLLTVALSKEPYIPMGNLITWAGIIALPASLYFGIDKLRIPQSSTDRYASFILKTLLVLAILWAPVCYLLSGNFSFSFGNRETFQGGQAAMRLFWYFNYFMAGSPLVLLILYKIISYFRRRKNQPPVI